MSIGRSIYRHRLWIVLAWLVAAAALVLLVPKVDPQRNEVKSFLPADAPSRQATELISTRFSEGDGLAEAVVIFERTEGPLTGADLRAIEHLADAVRSQAEGGDTTTAATATKSQGSALGLLPAASADTPAIQQGATPKHELGGASALAMAPAITGSIRVESPASFAMPLLSLAVPGPQANPLISPIGPQGQAGLVIVTIPSTYISLRSDRVVRDIYDLLWAMPLPAGLQASVTGSAGFGHDYAVAAQTSYDRTMTVTIAAVIVILAAVFRAPLAALVPLGAISVAAVAASGVLRLAAHAGLHVGTAENIFVFTLLYGAGIDYSLLLISRCREYFNSRPHAPRIAAMGLDRSFSAIAGSAMTNSLGLLMLVFAGYGVFRTAGPAIAIALVVTMLAALTLVPAAIGLLGTLLFWPLRPQGRRTTAMGTGSGLWRRLAGVVVARPGLVLAVTMLAMALPIRQGLRTHKVYDLLAWLPAEQSAGVGNAATGLQAARRHWPVGQIAPMTALVALDKPLDAQAWSALASRMSQQLLRKDGVGGVRSLVAPLGELAGTGVQTALRIAAGPTIFQRYVSRDGTMMRLIVSLSDPPLSDAGMERAQAVAADLQASLDRAGLAGRVLLSGSTAEMIDVRRITGQDFWIVAGLCGAVIYLVVVILLRDLVLPAVMIAATVVGYLATLGATSWVFVGLLGWDGLDWKVSVFLFVVMLAVGQDYNIFLAARLAQESRRLPIRRAVGTALVHTGPVISSCGLIMAATLGSLMSGSLGMLQQLGFALAVGMLMDTFVLRPLVLPAAAVLLERMGWSGLSRSKAISRTMTLPDAGKPPDIP